MECETYNKMWPLFCRWKGSLLSILFVMEMIQKKLSMQKYWKFLDLRPGTTTSSYVCRMWLWDNWQKLLYFLQMAGMFVPRCDVTPSTMVFQHCTSNNKFYFKAFFIKKIFSLSISQTQIKGQKKPESHIFLCSRPWNHFYVGDEWYFPPGKPYSNPTLVSNYTWEQDHPLKD